MTTERFYDRPEGFARIIVADGLESSTEVRCLECGLRVERPHTDRHFASHLQVEYRATELLLRAADAIAKATTEAMSADRKTAWRRTPQEAVGSALRAVVEREHGQVAMLLREIEERNA